MNISGIAAFADVLAASGVIASLLIVAFQVRQNTRTVRNQHWEMHLGRLAETFARPLDMSVATVIDKGRQNYEALSGEEKVVFNGWASEYLANVFGSLGFQQEGILDKERAVLGEQRLKWFFKDKGTVHWWHDSERHPVPPPMKNFADTILSKLSPLPA